MAQDSRPWTGITLGDAGPYSADEWAEIWRTLLAGHTTSPWQRSCVVAGDVGTGALAVSGTPSPVNIAAGQALVHGTWYENDVATTLAIPTPGALTRIDRVVLEKDWATQTVRIARLAGAEGGGAPALTQTDGVLWQVSLAQASITIGGVITLTDERVFGPFPAGMTPAMFTVNQINNAGLVNRTRDLWIPAGDFQSALGAPTFGVTGGVPRWQMPDGSSTTVGAAVLLPSDWASGTVAILFYWASQGAGAGNFRLQSTAQAITPGAEALSGANDVSSTVTVVDSGSTLVTSDLSMAALTVAAADVMRVGFSRIGADGADSSTNTPDFIGCRLRYTADM